ncbi:MAG: glucose-6-phosphate dehydrogenase, partial [Patescibacteria group bacterium]
MQTLNKPTILVIFGATGDVVARKVIPSLYHLFRSKQLPQMFCIIGFSRREQDDRVFRDYIREMLTKHVSLPPPSNSPLGQGGEHVNDVNTFLELFSYVRAELDKPEDYTRLGEKLGLIDGEWKTCAHKLFYLAVPPSLYTPILNSLSISRLTESCGEDGVWTRVLVEKPIGTNQATAETIDTQLSQLFKEEQIYRIEHYLAKEMVRTILAFRFRNDLFESIWNHEQIESVHVHLHETLGVEKRGSFYDALGTLRDVGQNHLLQLLALIAMDKPSSLEPDAIRHERAAILSHLKPMSLADIQSNTFRAQYNGYREIIGVDQQSNTETYFRLTAEVQTERWSGVPFILDAGKRISNIKKEIVITFKHTIPCLCSSDTHQKNRIVIS